MGRKGPGDNPNWKPELRGPNGRGLCRWCLTEVPPKKRTWCSQACIDEYLMQNDWSRITDAVYKRDKGICAKCGIDTYELKKFIDSQNFRAQVMLASALRIGGSRLVLWDADHIKPVVEGGGNDLSNLRTLCIWCHRDETAQLATRRAAEKRAEKPKKAKPKAKPKKTKKKKKS